MRTTLILLAVALFATASIAASDVRLIANGRTIVSNPAPMIHQGHTYVPLRAAAEAVGGTVDYDATHRRVTICRGDLCTMLRQDEGITVNGRLLIGIRQVGEALNARVHWDAASRTVRITTMD